MQWWIVAVLSRCCAVPSSSIDVLDRGDVLRSGDIGDVAWLWRSPFFFLYSLFSLGSTAQWTATKWRRGDERAQGLLGPGLL